MTRAPSLHARVQVPERDVDLLLEVAPGETVAVVGANGAGKSTLLETAAGLLRPPGCSVRLGEREVADLPAHARRVGLLAQDPLLFPHLSVLENVAFGPRHGGLGRSAARERAREWLREVGVEPLAARRPREVSGGQAQRVALARALAADPDLLLLDEPLAALDVSVAPEIRQVLRRVLAERTVVLVTHDVLDVLTLADRLVVLDAGRVVEDGPARDVLQRPRSTFAARLAGLNLVAGTATDDGVRDGALHVHATPVPGAVAPVPGEPAVAVFAPRAVAVHLDPPGGSPRTVLAARVLRLDPHGDLVRVVAQPRDAGPEGASLSADVTAGAVADLGLVPGLDVHLVVKASEVALHAL